MRKIFLALLGLAAACVAALQAGAGEEPRSLADLTKALQALPADDKAASEAIPEKGRKLLADLKREVGLTIQEIVPTGGKQDADKIRDDLVKKLKSRDVQVGSEEKKEKEKEEKKEKTAGGFGRVADLEVAVSPQDEDLLAVEATFSLPCGWTDTDFYLFRYTKRGWKNILVQTTAEYGDISGGQGRFDYAMSNKSEEGSTLVVTAFVQPQCKAASLPIRYNVYRVSPGPLEAQSVFSGITSVGAVGGTYELQQEDVGMALSYTIPGPSAKAPGGTLETLHLRPRGTKLEITRSRGKKSG